MRLPSRYPVQQLQTLVAARTGPILVVDDDEEVRTVLRQLIADWGPTTLFLNGDTTLESAESERLLALGITIEPAPIAVLEGPGQALQGVRLQAASSGDARVVPLAALYVAASTRPASPLAEQLGCAFDDGPMGPYLRTDANKMTTVPGVYAAGDLTLMRHNATLASAEGVLAGVGAHLALVFGG